MSRVSDTRQRTRHAAAELVAAGRRPHELTVDLIYAAIRQGSRTTINDELKLWKDEQTKVDALSAALPAPVANAMLAAWAVAVEHGERVFDQRRDDVEAELAQAASRATAAEAAHGRLREEVATLTAQLDAARADLATSRHHHQTDREAKDAALLRAHLAEERTAAERVEAQQRLDGLREVQEQHLQRLRDAQVAKEDDLRGELARATQRLEGVQRHVMLQVTEAREAQKRAEDQHAKAMQRSERLASELEPLRAQVAAVTAQLQRALMDHQAAAADGQLLRTERDDLKVQLATTVGRLEAAMQQVSDLRERSMTPQATPGKAAHPKRSRGVEPTASE